MATTYTVSKVERTGATFPGIGGVWSVRAYGPADSTIQAGSIVYAPDGVILDVQSVSQRPDGNIEIVATKAAKDISFAVSPKGWLTLTGGEGAQRAVTPPSGLGKLADMQDFGDLPTWAKVATVAGVGLLGLAVLNSLSDRER